MGSREFSSFEPLRGYPLAAGSRGVSAHTLGGVRGAEPRDAEPKPLDQTESEQPDHIWLRQNPWCVARWDNSTLHNLIIAD
jgi:hypothetical protein